MDAMRQRILVVDDDPSLAEMLTIVLRNEGFDTRHETGEATDDGHDAWATSLGPAGAAHVRMRCWRMRSSFHVAPPSTGPAGP